jgi:hypothetical protein
VGVPRGRLGPGCEPLHRASGDGDGNERGKFLGRGPGGREREASGPGARRGLYRVGACLWGGLDREQCRHFRGGDGRTDRRTEKSRARFRVGGKRSFERNPYPNFRGGDGQTDGEVGLVSE